MSFNDSIHLNLIGYGGAWNAAKRITEAIEIQGHGAKAICLLNPNNRPFTSTKAIFKVDYELGRLSGAPTSISVMRGYSSKHWVSKLESEKIQANVWNLHWMPGHIDSAFLDFFRNKNVIWTMHDMNPFTGACHYSGSCREYKERCNRCPQVPSMLHPIVRGLLKNKIHSIRQFRNLTIVSPSKWLFDTFNESSLGQDIDIRHIPNPVFQSKSTETEENSIPTITILGRNYSESKNSLMGARAILKLKEIFPESRFNLQVVGLPFPEIPGNQDCLAIGSSQEQTMHFLEQSDVFIYTSTLDNLPNFVLEAQSAGNAIVAFDKGGISECFIPKVSGVLVEEKEVAIASALSRLLTDKVMRDEMGSQGRKFVKQTFSAQIVGNSYVSLYKEKSQP
jgi:glycosyltransferase involved in cell wall biosynthesis